MSAERQRRYRAHKRDDHSLCLPGCEDRAAVTAVTRPRSVTPVTSPRPPRLNATGRRLWADLGGDRATGGARALIVEACRIVDRLDKLDRQLADGSTWLTLKPNDTGDEVTVLVDKPLAEARQQALALKQIVAELRQSSDAAPAETEGSVFDQLAARREARRANAAG